MVLPLLLLVVVLLLALLPVIMVLLLVISVHAVVHRCSCCYWPICCVSLSSLS